jgi:hypothetical protein
VVVDQDEDEKEEEEEEEVEEVEEADEVEEVEEEKEDYRMKYHDKYHGSSKANNTVIDE